MLEVPRMLPRCPLLAQVARSGFDDMAENLGRAVLFQRGHINHEAVLYIALGETFVRLVDVLDLDHFDV